MFTLVGHVNVGVSFNFGRHRVRPEIRPSEKLALDLDGIACLFNAGKLKHENWPVKRLHAFVFRVK